MELSIKELWTVAHGMVFGSVFLLAFSGALADLFEFKGPWVTREGSAASAQRLKWGLGLMAITAWVTVISGTWLVYIWYRAKP